MKLENIFREENEIKVHEVIDSVLLNIHVYFIYFEYFFYIQKIAIFSD